MQSLYSVATSNSIQNLPIYDSLGKAYARDGQRELAMQNYQKSIELNPKIQNAIDRLKKLKKNKIEYVERFLQLTLRSFRRRRIG